MYNDLILDFSEMPELMSNINERNTQLLDRLKNVYVSSPDKVCYCVKTPAEIYAWIQFTKEIFSL